MRTVPREPKIQDRAVSPVIAVILMVAITVILSAVIGTFVLDIGSDLNESPPQATFETEQDTITKRGFDWTVLNISHVGGETVEQSNIKVTANGEEALGYVSGTNLVAKRLWSGNSEIQAGDQISVISKTDADIDPSKTYRYDRTPESSFNRVAIQRGNRGGASNELDGEVQLQQGATVRIIYQSTEGNSQILYEYTVK